MSSDCASPTLAIISFRIANEPDYIEALKSQVKARQLDSGQAISEEDASVLMALLDKVFPLPKTIADWEIDPGEYESWLG